MARPVVPARCAPARQWTMTFLPLAKADPVDFCLKLENSKDGKEKLEAD